MRGMYGDKPVVATVASNAKSSTAIYIGGANRIALEIPSFGSDLATATANIFVMGGDTESGTFRRIKDMGVYSATSGINDWEVPSTTGDYLVICDTVLGFGYMKIQLSNTATNGFLPNVHVMQ